MNKIASSELIINPNGSIYHINLKPEDIATDIILVGDQDRVSKVANHFDSIELKTQKREFKTITGTYRKKRISVISTGIGPDNVDIVINELDALFNIDFQTRTIKEDHTSLNIVRIGTSGSLQKDIPVDSFVLAKYGIGFDGLLHSYNSDHILEKEMEDAFIQHSNYSLTKARPYIVKNGANLENKLISDHIYSGITATAGGFYGPQGRVLRIPIHDPNLNQKIEDFNFNGLRLLNFEMETAAIYGLSQLLGHQAVSLNAIIANRVNLTFSQNPYKSIEELIEYTLNKLCT